MGKMWEVTQKINKPQQLQGFIVIWWKRGTHDQRHDRVQFVWIMHMFAHSTWGVECKCYA